MTNILDARPLVCPTCWRNGKETLIQPHLSNFVLPLSGEFKELIVYECEVCAYSTNEHELLFHEFRVKYHKLLEIVLNIRGWWKSSMNSPYGKLFVIGQAVEHYFVAPKDPNEKRAIDAHVHTVLKETDEIRL